MSDEPFVAEKSAIDDHFAVGKRPSFFRWRIYLYLHLLAVAGLSMMMTRSREQYFERGSWRDPVVEYGVVLLPAAILAIPLAYISPFVAMYLLIIALKRDQRFVAVLIAELGILAVNWYALLPAVQ